MAGNIQHSENVYEIAKCRVLCLEVVLESVGTVRDWLTVGIELHRLQASSRFTTTSLILLYDFLLDCF